MSRPIRRARAVAILLLAASGTAGGACGSDGGALQQGQDAGADSSTTPTGGAYGADGARTADHDAGADAAIASDAGADDASAGDANPGDAPVSDAREADAGQADARPDAPPVDAGPADAPPDAVTDATADAASTHDAAPTDAADLDSARTDAPSDAGADTADAVGGGILTGGPCVSGAAGAAAYRIRWIDAGGTAQVQYEVDGLPDKSRDKAGAYGYQIGFVPPFVDPFLAQGGLQLDSSDFVDLEISTAGVSTIASAALSIYGRSYSVDTSGSYSWQTFTGTSATPTDFVSNVAPYQWYSADMTSELAAGDGNVLVRIKAGPSSDALVVNRIELCLVAK